MQIYGLQAAALRVSQRRHLLFSLRRQAGEAAEVHCAWDLALGLEGGGEEWEVPELEAVQLGLGLGSEG